MINNNYSYLFYINYSFYQKKKNKKITNKENMYKNINYK